MRTGEIVDGRFVVEKFVARGGMGDIYRARDRSTGRPIALKMIVAASGRLADRMQNEARALLELTHPAVVRYVAHGTTSDHGLYLAMEWLDGVTLWERLHAAPLDLDESLTLVARVADGLGVAHGRGMVHRDIKPLNLLLVGGRVDRVKILDFGIVRWGRHITATGAGIGTPEYMSPEQARGERNIGPAADVFSLGCVLFKCLTGQVPFRGEHVAAILAKVAMFEKPPRVAELRHSVPPIVDDLVARMMEHSAADRLADGAAAAAAIRDVQRKLADVASPQARLKPQASLTRRENQPISVIYADLGFSRPDNPMVAAFLPTDPAISVPPAIASEAIPVVRGPSDTWQILPEVRRALEPFGARVEPLLDGSLVAMLGGASALTDLAVRSARCALALRALLPDASIGVATLQAQMDDGAALGEVIDGAVTRVRSGLKTVRIDRRTYSLVGDRFEVRSDDEGGYELVNERELVPHANDGRRLLGRATPFVGRNRILRQMLALYRGCVEDRAAQALVVVGEAGVGKSRLRAEFLAALANDSSPPTVLFARGDPLRAGLPFGALARAILSLLVPGDVSADEARAALSLATKRRMPDEDSRRVAEFLGEICGVEFPTENSPQLRAARQDPALMADHRRRAFEDWLADECAAQPVVLVVEDIQWVDRSTVEFVAGALRCARDLPLLVVALARYEANDRFPRLGEEWKRQELRLEPLRPTDCEELVRAAMGQVDNELIRQIIERSAGNPFFLEELIRAAASGDKTKGLPETVLGSVQLRLARLPEQARHALRAASIFGSVFRAPGVARLLGDEVSGQEVDDTLDFLVSSELLHHISGGAFAFRHDLVREAAYRMLTDSDRRIGHRLAGEWLLENGERDPVVLAEHFAGSGAVEQAMDWFQRAAEDALVNTTGLGTEDTTLRKAATYFRRAAEVCSATYANENAIAFYERAIALWASLDAGEAGRTRVACALLLERAGNRDKAAMELQRAEEEAQRAGDAPTRIEALLARSESEKRSGGGGSLERAWHLAERARDLAQSIGARELEAKALTGMAAVLWSHETEDASQKALQLARLAVSITTEHGDLATRLWRLGNGFLLRNDLDRAALIYREAQALAERTSDEMLAALCRGSSGMVQFRRWHLDAAIEETQRALAVFQRVGSRVRIAEMKLNLGAFWVKRGNFGVAEVHLNEVLAHAGGDWIIATASLDSLAQFERHRGDERAAQKHLGSAARLSEEVGVPQRHGLFLGMLAESYWVSGEFAEAIDCLERAASVASGPSLSHPLVLAQLGALEQAAELLEQFRDADPDPDRRSAARLALARVHWLLGDPELARQRCSDALELLSPTPLPRFVLPAEALMACLDGQPALALAALRAARVYCSPSVFAEVALDVGSCVVKELDTVDANELEKFLTATEDLSHVGIRYRVNYVRQRVCEHLGFRTRAASCAFASRQELELLSRSLPADFADTLMASAWVHEIVTQNIRAL